MGPPIDDLHRYQCPLTRIARLSTSTMASCGPNPHDVTPFSALHGEPLFLHERQMGGRSMLLGPGNQ